MRDVPGASLNKCFQRQRPGLRVNASSLKVFRFQRPKNPRHLIADCFDQQEFLFSIPFTVGQPGSEQFSSPPNSVGSFSAITRLMRSAPMISKSAKWQMTSNVDHLPGMGRAKVVAAHPGDCLSEQGGQPGSRQ